MGSLAIKTQVLANTVENEMIDGIKELTGDWNVVNVIKNTGGLLRTIGGALMVVIGVAMIIVGIFKIAQGMISHGKTQVNWVINILLILVGALFCAGAAFFTLLTNSDNNSVGAALTNTLTGLGNK